MKAPNYVQILYKIFEVNFGELREKIKQTYENLLIEEKRKQHRRKEKDEAEPFEWRKSNGDIPITVRNFISKKLRYGIKKLSFEKAMVPKALLKKGIIELTSEVTKTDIIVTGYRSINPEKIRKRILNYKCPQCNKRFITNMEMVTHLEDFHTVNIREDKIIQLLSNYIKTSSNAYTKMDDVKNKIKEFVNISRDCTSCSKPIEFRDYYKAKHRYYVKELVKKNLKRWTNPSSWIICSECEKKKKKLKRFF